MPFAVMFSPLPVSAALFFSPSICDSIPRMAATKKSKSRKSSAPKRKKARSPKTAARSAKSTSTSPSLNDTYATLQKILSLYAPPLLFSSTEKPKPWIRLTIPRSIAIPGIYSGKPIHLEVASFTPQKDSISFHYLPLYMNPALKSKLPPALTKLLKSKTCFHIKSLDSTLAEHINTAIEEATSFYRSRGWL
jgi:hypothetical protein